MNTTKPWANGPYELISSACLSREKSGQVRGCHAAAAEMIVVHNLFLRGANAMHLQCLNVERDAEAVPAFVNYCKVWCDELEDHHDAEEKMVFPELEKAIGVPGIMAVNVEQHKEFHDGLHAYRDLLVGVLEGQDKYQGAKIRAALEAFMQPLRKHLADEIETLLAIEKYDDMRDWGKWFKEMIDRVIKSKNNPNGNVVTIPWMIHHHHGEFEDGVFAAWPPIPWLVLVVFRWLYFGKNKAWWHFAPCDGHSKPKDLPFAN